MKQYSNYIFDFDYTLFDTSAGMNECYKRAIESIGYQYKAEELGLYVQESLEATLGRYTKDTTLFDAFEKIFLETSKNCMADLSIPYNDTIATLQILKSLSKDIYIVTGKPKDRVIEILSKFNCQNYISDIIGYGEYKSAKPSPESLNKCISLYNLPLEATVYIGDSPHDITAAEKAGIDSIHITRNDINDGISSLLELVREINVELFTTLSSEYDIFKNKDWKNLISEWCKLYDYTLVKVSKSSAIIKLDHTTSLSLAPNGIMIMNEYMKPQAENRPLEILAWKERINSEYKSNIESKPWMLLKRYNEYISNNTQLQKCPFDSRVHYTLIAYNYVVINRSIVDSDLAKHEILWLLTKNQESKISKQLSTIENLAMCGISIEIYSDTCFFSGLWGARAIISEQTDSLYFNDYVEIERNIQTLWIMLSLTNDYIDRTVSVETENKALTNLINFVYDIMFFEAEFKYINAKTSHRYQINTIRYLLELSNLNDISQYFKSKSDLLEKKLTTANNQKEQENASILNFTLLILTIVSSVAAIFDVINLWSGNGIETNRTSLIVSCGIAISIIIFCITMKVLMKHRRK